MRTSTTVLFLILVFVVMAGTIIGLTKIQLDGSNAAAQEECGQAAKIVPFIVKHDVETRIRHEKGMADFTCQLLLNVEGHWYWIDWALIREGPVEKGD